ncbi:MAG: thioredoxin domain-containing protein [Desulfobacterales bacterium]
MNQSTAKIIACAACGARNKIPIERIGAPARCGKCHAALDTAAKPGGADGSYTIRCPHCKARNRVPADKIDSGAKCGKCAQALPTGDLFIPQPVMVTDANFEKMVLGAPLPVLLFCWAPWCPTCGAVAPIIDEFARETKGKIRVGKLNVDGSPQVAARFNVMSVPYLFIFDNGEMKESLPGGLQKQQLMMKMAHYL